MKKTKESGKLKEKDRVQIKFVKAAGMWCKTTWKDGKQKQEWSVLKPV